MMHFLSVLGVNLQVFAASAGGDGLLHGHASYLVPTVILLGFTPFS